MQYKNDSENLGQETTKKSVEPEINYEERFEKMPFQCMYNCPFLFENKQRAYEDEDLGVIAYGGGHHGHGGGHGGHGGHGGGGHYNHGGGHYGHGEGHYGHGEGDYEHGENYYGHGNYYPYYNYYPDYSYYNY